MRLNASLVALSSNQSRIARRREGSSPKPRGFTKPRGLEGIDEMTFLDEEPAVTHRHTTSGARPTIPNNDPDPAALAQSAPIRWIEANQTFSF